MRAATRAPRALPRAAPCVPAARAPSPSDPARRDFPQGEGRAQEGRDPEQLERVILEEAEPAQDRQAERGRERHVLNLRASIYDADCALFVERPHQLADEQRVARGPGDFLEQEDPG